MFRRNLKPKPVKRNCEFCREHREPDYKDPEGLRRFLSERGKIFSKDRSGLCAKHQRRVALAIKRARFLAYLPFVTGL